MVVCVVLWLFVWLCGCLCGCFCCYLYDCLCGCLKVFLTFIESALRNKEQKCLSLIGCRTKVKVAGRNGWIVEGWSNHRASQANIISYTLIYNII